MPNENFKPDQNNKPENQELRPIAKRLEDAMKFEARPEFNAELRSRLMSNLARQKQTAQHSNQRSARFGLQGWRTAAAAFVLVLLGLGVFLNSYVAQPNNTLNTTEATPNIQENNNRTKFDQNPISAQLVKSDRELRKQFGMDETPSYESSLQYDRLLKKEILSASPSLASANDDKARIKIIQY